MTDEPPDVQTSLEPLLKELLDSLEEMWDRSDFRTFPSLMRCREVRTSAEAGATVLPVTSRPVRGLVGVQTHFLEREDSIEEATYRLVSDSFSAQAATRAEARRMHGALDNLGEFFAETPTLSYQLLLSSAFKTWSSEEFRAQLEAGKFRDRVNYQHPLADLLARAFVAQGFQVSNRVGFTSWDNVRDAVLDELVGVAGRRFYEYEIRIFLNGPLVDSPHDIELARLKVGDHNVVVHLGYATDELLTASPHEAPHGFQKANTVLRYSIELPVESEEESYLVAYPDAAAVAEVTVDALRLVRPLDDVGVLSLAVVPHHHVTPAIRETWATRYSPDLAPLQPVRFDFAEATLPALTESEIDDAKTTVTQLATEQVRSRRALRQALTRFRNSFERYTADDPERLLEYAIALEALYLSDQNDERTELTYRLALRLARFLKSDFEARAEAFNLVRDLYKFRSRIAHGASIDSFKASQRKRLQEVLAEAPSLVATSIVRVLEEEVGSDYWRKVELG